MTEIESEWTTIRIRAVDKNRLRILQGQLNVKRLHDVVNKAIFLLEKERKKK